MKVLKAGFRGLMILTMVVIGIVLIKDRYFHMIPEPVVTKPSQVIMSLEERQCTELIYMTHNIKLWEANMACKAHNNDIITANIYLRANRH